MISMSVDRAGRAVFEGLQVNPLPCARAYSANPVNPPNSLTLPFARTEINSTLPSRDPNPLWIADDDAEQLGVTCSACGRHDRLRYSPRIQQVRCDTHEDLPVDALLWPVLHRLAAAGPVHVTWRWVIAGLQHAGRHRYEEIS